MIGTKLAHYEITSHLGTGGMGEVYQAADSKLGRSVAIKLLPEAFTNDADRAARFEREARVLASLNHPNIAAIYGVEESGGRKFLVMELVPGETLAERIKRGAIPLDEALECARQIAEALEAAHDRDIVHRDLKPANIKITPQGKVKVLDFGLAKAVGVEGPGAGTSHSPTMMSATVAGVILGTAAYMSPEQARGRAVDKRTDNWAFGCVLYEMLTGRQAFEGEDVTDVISRIVRGEPKWDALPEKTPTRVRQFIARCLTKDPSRRLRDIGDGRIEIEEALHTPEERQAKEPGKPARSWPAWAVAGAAILVAVAIGGWALMRNVPTSTNSGISPPIRFSITPPRGWSFLEPPIAQEIGVSPDGKRIAFSVASNGSLGIAVRAMDALEAVLLPGTEGGRAPFWSPDGRSLGFNANGKMKRIDLSSGAVQVICDAAFFNRATWGSNGTILFDVVAGGGLFRVSATGGKPEPVLTQDTNKNEIYPEFLGDGQHFLSSLFNLPDPMPTRVGTLETKQFRTILSSDTGVQYAAGHLFYVQTGKLMVQGFDEAKLEPVNEARRLVESVWLNPVVNYPGFGVSRDYVVFGTGSVPETQLVWLDRAGKEVGRVGAPDRYVGVTLSPTETQAAVSRFDPQNRTFDIWTVDLRSGTPSRATFDSVYESLPVWSPNGETIVFSQVTGAVNKKLINGSTQAERTTTLIRGEPVSWSLDGKYIAHTTAPITGGDIGLLPMSGDGKPEIFLHESFDHTDPQISPNSKWMAYSANGSGRPEIYVVSFPKPEGKWQISIDGGVRPRWRRDGKELFFMSLSGQLMAIDLNGDGTILQKGVPKSLFDAPGPRLQSWNYNYDVSQNGQRFLFNKVMESSETPTITVISNWQGLLQ